MSEPIRIAEGRSMLVTQGARVITGYVPIHKVRLGCRDRMAVGDVEVAYRRQLQLGPSQAWPCPTGEWDGDTFVVHDGRHHTVACLMLGIEHLFVAWLEPA